jgi:hypothetical protein
MPEQSSIYKGMYDDTAAMTPERLDYLRDRLKVEYGGGYTRPQEQAETREGQGWTERPGLADGAVMLGGSMLNRFAIEPLEAMARTGDALRTGKSGYVVDEVNDPKTVTAAMVRDVMEGVGVAGGPQVAKGAFSRKVPSATTLGIFGGQGAKEAPLRMKEIAEKALAAGKDPDEVWKWTGWKKGMEGKMRFEISDKDMAINPEFWGPGGARHSAWMDPKKNEWADIRMGQVAKHDAAYANYPEMRDVKVRLGHPEAMGSKNGFFDEVTNTATIKDNLTLEEAREVLLHEVGAHYVQGKEGFARGGSIASETKIAMENAVKNPGSILETGDPYWLGKKNYRNLAGEIEAKDIVNRRTWDTEMRRAVPPAFKKDAIIRMRD